MRKDIILHDEWTSRMDPVVYQKAINLVRYTNGLRKAGVEVYPEKHNIFRALNSVLPDDVRVVILGQDPYHEPGQANGLAFSVDAGIALPPSLRNIYKEISQEYSVPVSSVKNILTWPDYGVLLLNSVLTVERGKAGSHSEFGWQQVTEEFLRIVLQCGHHVVFLCFGNFAINLYRSLVNKYGACQSGVVFSTHPSPLSANRNGKEIPAFSGSGIFVKANALLVSNGCTPVPFVRDQTAKEKF